MGKKMPFSISIVIPNWNGMELLKKHLPAIMRCRNEADIIIADDCSTDDSVSYIQKNFPDITVVRMDKHEGFASTVNAGVRGANTDIVVLLNTDIEPETGFLQPLISHFSDPLIFAVGCLDKSHEGKQTILRGRGIARWENGFYIHARGEVNESDTAWVSGGSSAFRRSMWDKLGGMDTRLNTFYWEDIDLSYRAKQAGYKILFEPKSIVHHYHEEGSIKEKFSKKYIETIAYRNQFLFEMKHMPSVSQRLSFIFWTPIRIFQLLLRQDTSMLQGFILSVIRFL